jgi:putative tributyrin esterase
VLYLLHGWSGDHTNWLTLTNLVEYARQYQMIIVTPDGRNSWYVNSATNPGERFQEYLIGDLLLEVDRTWRTIASPHRRAIAGLSMGGYGSLLLALKYPELFAAVGAVSGAFDGPSGVEAVLPDLRESTEAAYGTAGSVVRCDNDVFSRLVKADPRKLPYLYLAYGASDVLLDSHRRMIGILSSRGFAYEYYESPGDHTWQFWDESPPGMLRVLIKHIAYDPRP